MLQEFLNEVEGFLSYNIYNNLSFTVTEEFASKLIMKRAIKHYLDFFIEGNVLVSHEVEVEMLRDAAG